VPSARRRVLGRSKNWEGKGELAGEEADSSIGGSGELNCSAKKRRETIREVEADGISMVERSGSYFAISSATCKTAYQPVNNM
jgi:hypothetical protein